MMGVHRLLTMPLCCMAEKEKTASRNTSNWANPINRNSLNSSNPFNMKRKEFVYQCGGACVGGALLATWLQSCNTQKAITATLQDRHLVVPISFFYSEQNKKWNRVILVR